MATGSKEQYLSFCDRYSSVELSLPLSTQHHEALNDPFPYKFFIDSPTSDLSSLAAFVLARHLVGGSLEPHHCLVVTGTVIAAQRMRDVIRGALRFACRVQRGTRWSNRVFEMRIIDEDSLLTLLDSVPQQSLSGSATTVSLPILVDSIMPQDVENRAHKAGRLASVVQWDLREEDVKSVLTQPMAQPYSAVKAELSTGKYSRSRAALIPTDPLALRLSHFLHNYKHVIVEDTSDVFLQCVQRLLLDAAPVRGGAFLGFSATLIARNFPAPPTVFRFPDGSCFPLSRFDSPIKSLQTTTVPITRITSMPFRQDEPRALLDLVRLSLGSEQLPLNGVADVLIACESNLVVMETALTLDSHRIPFAIQNRMLSKEFRAVKSFLHVLWAHAVQSAALNTVRAEGRPEAASAVSLKEAELMSRHMFIVLQEWFSISLPHDPEASWQLSNLFLHSAMFGRPIENVLAAALAGDEFVRIRLGNQPRRSFPNRQLKQSILMGYTGVNSGSQSHTPGDLPTQNPIPPRLLQSLRNLFSEMQPLLRILETQPPEQAISEVVAAILLRPRLRESKADFQNLARTFDGVFVPEPSKNFLETNTLRLQKFIGLLSTSSAELTNNFIARVVVANADCVASSAVNLKSRVSILRKPSGSWAHSASIFKRSRSSGTRIWELELQRLTARTLEQVYVLSADWDSSLVDVSINDKITRVVFDSATYKAMISAVQPHDALALRLPELPPLFSIPLPIVDRMAKVDASYKSLCLFEKCQLAVRLSQIARPARTLIRFSSSLHIFFPFRGEFPIRHWPAQPSTQ